VLGAAARLLIAMHPAMSAASYPRRQRAITHPGLATGITVLGLAAGSLANMVIPGRGSQGQLGIGVKDAFTWLSAYACLHDLRLPDQAAAPVTARRASLAAFLRE
jgi:hypothetical protein